MVEVVAVCNDWAVAELDHRVNRDVGSDVTVLNGLQQTTLPSTIVMAYSQLTQISTLHIWFLQYFP